MWGATFAGGGFFAAEQPPQPLAQPFPVRDFQARCAKNEPQPATAVRTRRFCSHMLIDSIRFAAFFALWALRCHARLCSTQG